MKINKKFHLYLASLFVAIGLTSCVQDLDIQPIDPSIVQTFNETEVFTKVYAAWALTGQQGPAGNNDIEIDDEGRFSLYRTLWVTQQLPTDETVCAWGDIEIVTMNRSAFTSTNPAFKGLYARLYFVVTIANHYLEATQASADDATIKTKRAEVRYLRALAYYYLMDVFGNVPFTTEVKADAPTQIKRADLYAWIETELKELEPVLSAPKQAPYYRVDQAAAWMLFSRLYLNAQVYTGTPKWNEAAIYADKVMKSGYTLASNYKYLFMADNAGTVDGSTVNDSPKEIIFPIAADGVKTKNYGTSIFVINSTRTTGMPTWGTTGGWGGNRARVKLIRKFFPGDVPEAEDLSVAANDNRAMFSSKERSLNISDVTIFKEGISVQKFWNLRADGKPTSDMEFPDMDIPFMRAAEAYLTYAEAVVRGASPIGGFTALQAVNTVRTRAKASVLVAVDKDIILDEWSREFYFEGRRRTDLIRYGYFTGSVYNWDWKGGVANGTSLPAYLNLMPLPADDLNANSNLEQNPEY
ncbi:MAG: RagB/SusD family nutrient uptake outer membrane protein [Paludibacteraceae bacterium]